ncbi:hypothetical protein ACFOZ0_25490 [Streptomyces yaanensis]|uniref:Uncharacterized protein n=1 Tax=Streptomyces yaanensis TaxID=1142239 RepID=A0ABV7SKW1_9ACTN|nr:hypothetical protein [Streptomyces sp. CGMCC 4.7035]WNC01541.1 hypothetical protein Q2K21_27695 [Streptomyces sp. CGMCC 4.7035]
MTACAFTSATGNGNHWAARPGCVITADGSYAARLALDGESWYPERWTLDGPEPYAVPLPGNQPEEPGTEVQPMADGRVLIHRVADGRHTFSLLYPTGPGTGELALGAVEFREEGARLSLLPPAPTGDRAYALAVDRGMTTVWLVAGGASGPERLALVPGRCSGGVWLDRTGRLLALDRTPDGGPTKTVVVDLARGGEVSPLLQIAEASDDRVLLADPDSGLLLIRSDAPSPGHARLGWGVLGSTLPVRFPECLRLGDCAVTPFAIQPGQVLTPESCAVALRVDGAAGSWVAVWRPADRQVHHLAPPQGWLAGAGLWTREGVLRLPYATGVVRCGVTSVEAPARTDRAAHAEDAGEGSEPERADRGAARPVPLQQAPLQQAPLQQASLQQGPSRQTPSQQTPPQQEPSRQAPSQQEPSRQTPPHQKPSRQAPSQQTSPQQTPLRARTPAASTGVSLKRRPLATPETRPPATPETRPLTTPETRPPAPPEETPLTPGPAVVAAR